MRAATSWGALAGVVLALCGCGSSSSGTTSGTTSGGGAKTSTSPASVHIDTSPRFAAPTAATPLQSGVVQIAYRDIAIFPDVVRVKAGSTVKWTNYDPVEHNVTSVNGPQRLRSGNFGQGHSYQVVLSRPGTVHYVSTTQPTTMNGTIEVVG
ncbi:MAG TPA: hypothetical protein VMB91_08405 [Solirubrobacteraceae bacterium]|nr:hypothetical protein [Solirubrobacteraceae bacterium]